MERSNYQRDFASASTSSGGRTVAEERRWFVAWLPSDLPLLLRSQTTGQDGILVASTAKEKVEEVLDLLRMRKADVQIAEFSTLAAADAAVSTRLGLPPLYYIDDKDKEPKRWPPETTTTESLLTKSK